MQEELRQLVGAGERILFEGKPDKRCFIFESIFNPLLPFAIIWAIIDLNIIGFGPVAVEAEYLFFMVPFMLLHMMPVWIYLGGVLLTVKRYQNTNYIVTDRSIYVSRGALTKQINVKPFAELSHINLHRGIFDQIFKVADIICTTDQLNQNGVNQTVSLDCISNYTEVYNIIKKVQTDIYTDVMYPNALRPKENPGYDTNYKGL